jgi:hypothetical protein
MTDLAKFVFQGIWLEEWVSSAQNSIARQKVE